MFPKNLCKYSSMSVYSKKICPHVSKQCVLENFVQSFHAKFSRRLEKFAIHFLFWKVLWWNEGNTNFVYT